MFTLQGLIGLERVIPVAEKLGVTKPMPKFLLLLEQMVKVQPQQRLRLF
jgi:hypothetical protein